jgi:hypothetical protein
MLLWPKQLCMWPVPAGCPKLNLTVWKDGFVMLMKGFTGKAAMIRTQRMLADLATAPTDPVQLKFSRPPKVNPAPVPDQVGVPISPAAAKAVIIRVQSQFLTHLSPHQFGRNDHG